MTEATKERIKYLTELLKLLVTLDIAISIGISDLAFKVYEDNKLAKYLLMPTAIFLLVFVFMTIAVILRLQRLIYNKR